MSPVELEILSSDDENDGSSSIKKYASAQVIYYDKSPGFLNPSEIIKIKKMGMINQMKTKTLMC